MTETFIFLPTVIAPYHSQRENQTELNLNNDDDILSYFILLNESNRFAIQLLSYQ